MLKQIKRIISIFVLAAFISSSFKTVSYAELPVVALPVPGTMVNLSQTYEPILIKGLTIHKDNPFLFDFVMDTGHSKLTTNDQQLKTEADRLIKYFFACLTIPEKDLWVNLSPYEKDRMAPEALGQTALGRDLLAEDYILKQLTASLIYPEKDLGKEFWNKVYTKAQQMYGTTQIPVNTFNKVWILADKATVYEHGQTAFVVGGHLKVMLEEDYLAMNKQMPPTRGHVPTETTKNVSPSTLPSDQGLNVKASQGNPQTTNGTNQIGSQIIRDIVLPEIEREVNTGKNFATLRQIFNSLILASWYKKNLKEALLNQLYADKSTVKGVNLDDPTVKEEIYQQYLKAYKKGVFNYIKEDVAADGQTVPRKYFSGGFAANPAMLNVTQNAAMVHDVVAGSLVDFAVVANTQKNAAMSDLPADLKENEIQTRFYQAVQTVWDNVLQNSPEDQMFQGQLRQNFPGWTFEILKRPFQSIESQNFSQEEPNIPPHKVITHNMILLSELKNDGFSQPIELKKSDGPWQRVEFNEAGLLTGPELHLIKVRMLKDGGLKAVFHVLWSSERLIVYQANEAMLGEKQTKRLQLLVSMKQVVKAVSKEVPSLAIEDVLKHRKVFPHYTSPIDDQVDQYLVYSAPEALPLFTKNLESKAAALIGEKYARIFVDIIMRNQQSVTFREDSLRLIHVFEKDAEAAFLEYGPVFSSQQSITLTIPTNYQGALLIKSTKNMEEVLEPVRTWQEGTFDDDAKQFDYVVQKAGKDWRITISMKDKNSKSEYVAGFIPDAAMKSSEFDYPDSNQMISFVKGVLKKEQNIENLLDETSQKIQILKKKMGWKGSITIERIPQGMIDGELKEASPGDTVVLSESSIMSVKNFLFRNDITNSYRYQQFYKITYRDFKKKKHVIFFGVGIKNFWQLNLNQKDNTGDVSDTKRKVAREILKQMDQVRPGEEIKVDLPGVDYLREFHSITDEIELDAEAQGGFKTVFLKSKIYTSPKKNVKPVGSLTLDQNNRGFLRKLLGQVAFTSEQEKIFALVREYGREYFDEDTLMRWREKPFEAYFSRKTSYIPENLDNVKNDPVVIDLDNGGQAQIEDKNNVLKDLNRKKQPMIFIDIYSPQSEQPKGFVVLQGVNKNRFIIFQEDPAMASKNKSKNSNSKAPENEKNPSIFSKKGKREWLEKWLGRKPTKDEIESSPAMTAQLPDAEIKRLVDGKKVMMLGFPLSMSEAWKQEGYSIAVPDKEVLEDTSTSLDAVVIRVNDDVAETQRVIAEVRKFRESVPIFIWGSSKFLKYFDPRKVTFEPMDNEDHFYNTALKLAQRLKMTQPQTTATSLKGEPTRVVGIESIKGNPAGMMHIKLIESIQPKTGDKVLLRDRISDQFWDLTTLVEAIMDDRENKPINEIGGSSPHTFNGLPREGSYDPSRYELQIHSDAAMTPGGIDLNSANMGMTVQKDANGGVKVDFDPSMIERFKREGIQSMVPVIINMTPISDIRLLLGLNASPLTNS